jgi:dUTP pyrophosphatase
MLKLSTIGDNVTVPSQGSRFSAGIDLYASHSVIIPPWERKLINTGLLVQHIEPEHYLRVAPRSGLSVKGIDVGAGVIDSDYRGQIKVILINSSSKEYSVTSGDRIAQAIMEKCTILNTIYINEEIHTFNFDKERGSGGFGSTGK